MEKDKTKKIDCSARWLSGRETLTLSELGMLAAMFINFRDKYEADFFDKLSVYAVDFSEKQGGQLMESLAAKGYLEKDRDGKFGDGLFVDYLKEKKAPQKYIAYDCEWFEGVDLKKVETETQKTYMKILPEAAKRGGKLWTETGAALPLKDLAALLNIDARQLRKDLAALERVNGLKRDAAGVYYNEKQFAQMNPEREAKAANV